jgi:hypothetical protein
MVGIGGTLDHRCCEIRLSGVSIPFACKWLKSSGETVRKGLSDAPNVDSAGIQRSKWAEKYHFGNP